MSNWLSVCLSGFLRFVCSAVVKQQWPMAASARLTNLAASPVAASSTFALLEVQLLCGQQHMVKLAQLLLCLLSVSVCNEDAVFIAHLLL